MAEILGMKKYVCYHEASHAVVAFALGYHVDYLSTKIIRHKGEVLESGCIHIDQDVPDKDLVLITMAGRLAEEYLHSKIKPQRSVVRLYSSYITENNSDGDLIFKIISKPGGHSLRYYYKKSYEIVKANWKKIVVLANRIDTKNGSFLKGKTIKRIIGVK